MMGHTVEDEDDEECDELVIDSEGETDNDTINQHTLSLLIY